MPLAYLLLSLFTDSSETLNLAMFFYVTMGFAVLFSNLPLQTSLFFTAINRPIESALISVVRTLVLIPSFVFMGIVLLGAWGVGLGFLLADLLLIIILMVYLRQVDLADLIVLD